MPHFPIASSPFTSYSIAIVHCGESTLLEDTLISVLQHRSTACDVWVAHPRNYRDRYELDSEGVQFLAGSREATRLELLQLALGRVTTECVHVLLSGMEVSEGWDAAAVRHFCRPEVASVAPVRLDVRDPRRVRSAGLRYSLGGRRGLQGSGQLASELAPRGVLGPEFSAGFYRTGLLRELVSPSHAVGDELADVDWALSLLELGYESKLEPRSQVRGVVAASREGAFDAGRNAQRLFQRHVEGQGRFQSWARHPWVWLRDLCRLSSPQRLCGRLTALWEGEPEPEPRLLDLEAARGAGRGEQAATERRRAA